MQVKTDSIQDQFDRNLIEKCFKNAITEVIGTMAGLDLWEARQEDLNNEIQENLFLSGMMMVAGQRNAMVSITVSKDAAIKLVSYMTGIFQSSITSEDLCDGMAELVNMVAGRAKAQLADNEYGFMLTTPFVIMGDRHSIYQKSNVKSVSKKYISQDMALFLKVFFL